VKSVLRSWITRVQDPLEK